MAAPKDVSVLISQTTAAPLYVYVKDLRWSGGGFFCLSGQALTHHRKQEGQL